MFVLFFIRVSLYSLILCFSTFFFSWMFLFGCKYYSRWLCRWCCPIWIMATPRLPVYLETSLTDCSRWSTPQHNLFALLESTEYITPLLRDLHWLPAREQIEFKLAVLVFRCLHGMAPPYLANELCRVADIDARRRLRSASTSALVTPSSRRSTIGDRAFFVAAPRVWNSLPSSVTASQTLGTFRHRLKTHLFAVSLT